MARLGDIFDAQITGEWGNECEDIENATNVIRTTNFTHTGVIDYKNIAKRDIARSKIEKKRLHKGDIILEKSGGTDKTPVGRVVYCDDLIEKDIYLCNNFTQAMRVNVVAAFPKYVFYYMCFLHSSGITDLLQNKTTGIRNLKIREYLNEEIPLPSLDEQRKIAAVLDKISGLTAKRSRQLDKLDELVKSRFVEMFGDVINNDRHWQVFTLKNIAESRLGKMLDSSKQTGDSTFPYLANFNVQWFYFDLDKLNQMDFDEKDRAEFELQAEDLLVCEGGEVGRCAVWNCELPHCYFQKAIHRVRCNQEIVLPNYMAWWFKYNCDNNGFVSVVGSKATIAHLTGVKLKQLKVVVPPLELQHQFVRIGEQVEKAKSTIQRSLSTLETLKKSLMQEYFLMR